MWRRNKRSYGRESLIGGAALGVAGALAFGIRAWRRRAREHERLPDELDLLEERAVAELRRDPRTDGLEIEVAAVAPGVLELTGRVRTVEEATDAVAVAQRVEDAHAVLNRLTVTALESHLERSRQRYVRGEPPARERHWYGMRVGTGRRRQAPATEPDRPDDRVRSIERELEPDALEAAREAERERKRR